MKLISIQAGLRKLTREKGRELAFLGPTTPGGVAGTPQVFEKRFKVDEPEMLMMITSEVATNRLDADVSDLKRATLEIFGQGERADATSSDSVFGEGDIAMFHNQSYTKQQEAMEAVETGSAGYAIDFSKQTLWADWAFLLEEDDVVTTRLFLESDVALSNILSARINIVTAVSAPRSV